MVKTSDVDDNTSAKMIISTTGNDETKNQALTINDNSFVGVGTTSPSAKLQVNGGDIRLSAVDGDNPYTLRSYSNANSLWFIPDLQSGGNYSTTNSIDADVWPNSGAWEFQNGDRSKLMRSDNVVMSISVTQTTLRTSFTVSGGLKEGNWVFDFVKQ